jgi:hypothetical protein
MGWSSANHIFNETINVAILASVKGEALTRIAETLIGELQDGDWDTESESVDLFMECPEIIEAFRRRGILIPCDCNCCKHETERY